VLHWLTGGVVALCEGCSYKDGTALIRLPAALVLSLRREDWDEVAGWLQELGADVVTTEQKLRQDMGEPPPSPCIGSGPTFCCTLSCHLERSVFAHRVACSRDCKLRAGRQRVMGRTNLHATSCTTPLGAPTCQMRRRSLLHGVGAYVPM
jgi:hypothetical protein